MTDEKKASPNGDTWVTIEDMNPPAGARQEKETPLTPDQVAEIRVYNLPDEKGRGETPKAFLLTRKEAKLLYKASIINIDTWTRLLLNEAKPGAIGNAVDQETILQETERAWSEQDVSVSALQKIYRRVDNNKYWNYRTAVLLIPLEDSDGQYDYESTTVIYINKTVHRSFPYEGDRGYQIVQASNPVEGARLAEVPEGIKYLPVSEYMALDDLRTIVEALTDKARGNEIKEALNLSIMPNSPVIDVFAEVGRQAINDRKAGGLSLAGKETSTIVSAKGVSIIRTSGDEDLFLSLSTDADRVLKVYIKEAIKDRDKGYSYYIPVNELAKRIGLKNAKELTKKIYPNEDGEPISKLEMIFNEIYGVSLEWKAPGFFFKSRIAGTAGVIPRKGRGGSLAGLTFVDNYANHFRSDRTGLYQIPDNITEIRDDNAYKIAIELFKAYRLNVGKITEGITSVQTLLKVTNIIPYEDLGKDKGKASQRIIRPFTNALDYLVDIGYLKEWTFGYMARDNKGTALCNEDLDRAYRNYRFFSGLAIHYVIDPEYKPDYTNLLKGREKQRKKAQKAKAKTTGGK